MAAVSSDSTIKWSPQWVHYSFGSKHENEYIMVFSNRPGIDIGALIPQMEWGL